MKGIEEQFLVEIEAGERVIPIYYDWLLEQGRNLEAEFWKDVEVMGWYPYRDRYILELLKRRKEWYTDGGTSKVCYTWSNATWMGREESGQRAILPENLLGKVPWWMNVLEPDKVYRDFPTWRSAMQGLWEGWKKLRGGDAGGRDE